jgi:prepilin-type N-terminal cleavage/methylation domain-containing protein
MIRRRNLPQNRSNAGFTLLELLISLALLGVLLTAVVYINISTSRSAAALQSRNDLLPELQIAQNYMAGKLREAAYVFPPASNVQMTAAGSTSVRPAGGNNWVVGTDPIVAFIVPPRTISAGACATATTFTVSDYCYAFYAFYAMKRDVYVAAVTGSDDPGTDAGNDTSSWVLVEYRSYYSSATLNTNSGYLASAASIPTGNRGRLLMDYLPVYSGATALFSTTNTTFSATGEAVGITTVVMNLAALQSVAGQTIRLPSSIVTDFASLTVYPRNVGKPMLVN